MHGHRFPCRAPVRRSCHTGRCRYGRTLSFHIRTRQPFQVSHPCKFRRRHHPRPLRSHGFRPENIFQMGNGKKHFFFVFSITVLLLPDLAFLLLVPSGDGASRQPYARRRIPLPPASLPYRSAYSSCTACRTDIRPAGLKDPAEFPELSRVPACFSRSRRGTERISAQVYG